MDNESNITVFSLLGFILGIPGMLLGWVRSIFGILFLLMACVALYSYKPVKNAVDPIAESAVEKAPQSLKKKATEFAIYTGLKEPPKTYGMIFAEKLKRIPAFFYNIGSEGAKMAFSKVLDLVFSPVMIIGLITIFLKIKGTI